MKKTISSIEVFQDMKVIEERTEEIMKKENYGVYSEDYEINFLIDEVRELRHELVEYTDIKVDRLDVVLEKLQSKVKEGMYFSLEQLEGMMEDRVVEEMPRIMAVSREIAVRVQNYMSNEYETEYLEKADMLYEEAQEILKEN